MTARGVDYLNEWVSENVPPLAVKGDVLIGALAQKLRDDLSAAGFSIADLEIENYQVEQFVGETLVHVRWTFKNVAPVRNHPLPGHLIVSLTSYPPRFTTLALTLKTLLCQNMRPNALILWIAEEDRESLPENVKKLTQQGLRIEYCDNLRSYKKIIPCLSRYPNSFIVTADDDLYYWPGWLAELALKFDPNSWEVLCHRAHLIRLNAAGEPIEYKRWVHNIDSKPSSDLQFPTNGSGALYRPSILHTDVTNVERFLELCPTADDIWLYFMARKVGAKFKKIGARRNLLPWLGSQELTLMTSNVYGGGNDRQMQAMLRTYGFWRSLS